MGCLLLKATKYQLIMAECILCLKTVFILGSMLLAMVSGEFNTQLSEAGSYFIDRDGTHFRYILNYLRTGKLMVPEDKVIRREILAEAEFYQVEGIINELRRSCFEPFEESVILSSEKRQTLINWMNDYSQDLTNTSLLYRASRDGWAASNFHSCCDNKGPTVTVVKSGYCIFGGHTGESWESPGKSRIMKRQKLMIQEVNIMEMGFKYVFA